MEKEWIEPVEVEFDGKLKIYERPLDGYKYILGVDPAKGTGKNSSCIQVIKIISISPIKLEQVAVFKDNKTDPYVFSKLLNRLGIWYNTGLIMLENNGEGAAVIQHIWWTYEYQNLYNTGNKNKDLGIRATQSTKTNAVLLMKKLIEEKMVKIVDYETIKQLNVFIETDGGSFKGQDNMDDDLCSSLYWALYAINLDIWDENVNIVNQENDEIAWGILSDIDDSIEWNF